MVNRQVRDLEEVPGYGLAHREWFSNEVSECFSASSETLGTRRKDVSRRALLRS